MAAHSENLERDKFALALINACHCVAPHSSVLQPAEATELSKVAFFSRPRANNITETAWLRWVQHCRVSSVDPGSPSHGDVIDFLVALAEGARSDRSRDRTSAAKGVVHALRFVARKLGLSVFSTLLQGPVVCSWLAAAKWTQQPAKEAFPLTLVRSV